MLSAESAAGQYPEESVRMQQRVIEACETSPRYMSMVCTRIGAAVDPAYASYDAVAAAASSLVRDLKEQGVLTLTTDGTTAKRFSRMRFSEPVIAMTPSARIARRLAMYWGVHPERLRMRATDSFHDFVSLACKIASAKGFVESETDKFVITAGFPLGTKGAANVIRVIPASGPQIFLSETSSKWLDQSDDEAPWPL